jgi:hypothetical protein
VQGLPKHEFGSSVLSPYPGHHPGAGLLVHYVSHKRPGLPYRT